MQGKPVALLLADLGVTRSHSRPRVSNDNPYSESQFKTLKYHPTFPARFGSLVDARGYCAHFFHWYNTVHRHMGIGWHTPADMHTGLAHARRAQRATVLDAAYAARPERFVRRPPVPPPAADRRVDQPTPTRRVRRRATVNATRPCLKVIDRFRGSTAGARGRDRLDSDGEAEYERICGVKDGHQGKAGFTY